ncbi:MAG: hypothetical protein IT374_00350 [Polyangiaceae bacterium]|nr:hypothetical protein [Polyangiaceae bacterium]
MDRPSRALVTAALTALTFVAAYPVARVAEHLVYGDPNPAAIVASGRVALYWRAGVVACLAVCLAPVYFERSARPQWILTNLTRLVAVAAACLALQAVVVP